MKEASKEFKKRIWTVVILLVLLGSGVFAWIYGNVTPEITGDFKIGSMSGLKFKINTTSTDLINLNEAFGIATESLNLNEVSGVDGKTFWARDTSYLYMESGNPNVNNAKEIITFRTAEKNEIVTATESNVLVKKITGDYMDVSFQMILDYSDTENADYYIYFLNGTLDNTVYQCGFSGGTGATTTADGLKALRACLCISGATGYGDEMQLDGSTSTHYAFFGNNSELGTVAEPYKTSAISAVQTVNLKLTEDATPEAKNIAGTYYIDYLTGNASPTSFGTLSHVDVYSFASCAIDPSGLNNQLEGTTVPNSNYLFQMDNSNHSVSINMRIWLEGGSDYCINGQIVPDDNIKLNLYFVAYKVPKSNP